jgi:hypothetical protein
MSPRAAARLEAIGFEDVYDCAAGKADWGASGLPLEGRPGLRASELARADTPTCTAREPPQTARARVLGSGWDTCLVVDRERVVIGRLGRRALAREDDVAVEDAMSEGPRNPSAGRPAGSARGVDAEPEPASAVVTTSDGRLVGVVRREEAEVRLGRERGSSDREVGELRERADEPAQVAAREQDPEHDEE